VAAQFENLLVAGRHPVPAIDVGPSNRAPHLHLMGNLDKPVGVVRAVTIKMHRSLLVAHCLHQMLLLGVVPVGLRSDDDRLLRQVA
jgi:hypothetical protein